MSGSEPSTCSSTSLSIWSARSLPRAAETLRFHSWLRDSAWLVRLELPIIAVTLDPARRCSPSGGIRGPCGGVRRCPCVLAELEQFSKRLRLVEGQEVRGDDPAPAGEIVEMLLQLRDRARGDEGDREGEGFAAPQLLEEGVFDRGAIGVEHQSRVVPPRSDCRAGDVPEVDVEPELAGPDRVERHADDTICTAGMSAGAQSGSSVVGDTHRISACSVSCGVPSTSWQRKVVNLTVPKSYA